MRHVLVMALVVLGVASCKKSSSNDLLPAPVAADKPKPIPANEIKRGQDACTALIARTCACPALAKDCALDKGYPDAIQVATEVVASPDSTRLDVLGAQDSMRKSFAHCVEEVAKLPATGCP